MRKRAVKDTHRGTGWAAGFARQLTTSTVSRFGSETPEPDDWRWRVDDRASARPGDHAIRAGPPEGARDTRFLVLRVPDRGQLAWMPTYVAGNDPKPPRWSFWQQVVGMAVAALMIPALFVGAFLVGWAYHRLTEILTALRW